MGGEAVGGEAVGGEAVWVVRLWVARLCGWQPVLLRIPMKQFT